MSENWKPGVSRGELLTRVESQLDLAVEACREYTKQAAKQVAGLRKILEMQKAEQEKLNNG